MPLLKCMLLSNVYIFLLYKNVYYKKEFAVHSSQWGLVMLDPTNLLCIDKNIMLFKSIINAKIDVYIKLYLNITYYKIC